MRRLDLRSEGGFTLVAVMVVMTVATALATGALLAAQQDLPFSKASSDRKQAYAAAEAGVEYYLYQLTNDNDYWTKCTNVPAPAPVNNKWTGTGARKWRALAGTNARFTIELLPPNGLTCTQGLAETTMLDQSTGTIKIRATGQSGKTTRSIVGEFRRDGFLDYIYFTDYETLSPEAYVDPADRTWAATNCNKYRPFRSTSCTNIQFASADFNRGPFHTNDDILACGGYTLGRNTADEIEISGPGKWRNPGGGGCNSGDPNLKGTLDFPAKVLDMPTTNAALQDNAGVTYTGRTTLYLHDGVVDVTNSAGVTAVNQALPANGVIYVETSPTLGCSTTQTPLRQTYNEAAGCANVTVYGTYSKSLTIGSQKDIIVGTPVSPTTGNPLTSSANLVRSGDAVLGLIADKFVRVSHAVDRSSGCTNRTAPNGLWMNDITIQAAILSLNHSFIVDNYECGQDLGTLSVDGAIAQRYRGPVGTGGSGAGTGFIKDYEYDDRFRYRSPPFFVNPVDAAWDVTRQNEQVPAAK